MTHWGLNSVTANKPSAKQKRAHFDAFALEFGQFHIGLRMALAHTVKDICKSPEFQHLDGLDARYRALFRRIKAEVRPYLASDRDIPDFSKDGVAKRMVDSWGRAPPTWDFKSGGRRFWAVIVFFYFRHLHRPFGTDAQTPRDERFANQIALQLDRSGTLVTKRTEAHRRKVNAAIQNPDPTRNPSADDYHSGQLRPPPDYERSLLKLLPNEQLSELAVLRRVYTNSEPGATPESMVLSMLLDDEFGSEVPDWAKGLVTESVRPVNIVDAALKQTDNRTIKATLIERDPEAFSRLELPTEDYWDQLLSVFLGRATQRDLRRMENGPLSRFITQVRRLHDTGVGVEYGSFFFGLLGAINRLEPRSRAICLYVKSIFDCLSGSMEDAVASASDAVDLLRQFDDRDVENLALLSLVISHRNSHLFTTATLDTINAEFIAVFESSTLDALALAGIDISDLNRIDVLCRNIENMHYTATHRKAMFMSTYLFECIEVLKSLDQNNRTMSEHHLTNILMLNESVSKTDPKVACYTLTPMTMLSEICGQTELALRFHKMRTGSHANREVNSIANGMERSTQLGVEQAFQMVSSYSLFRNLPSQHRAGEQKGKKLESKLLASREDFLKLRNGTVKRYFFRLMAELTGNRDDYLLSESCAASSHHLYMGRWNTQLLEERKRSW